MNARPATNLQVPHDRAVLRSPLGEPSARAAMFLPDAERPQYDNGIEPDEAARAACARARAKASGERT